MQTNILMENREISQTLVGINVCWGAWSHWIHYNSTFFRAQETKAGKKQEQVD